MSKVRSYRDLIVWQKSIALVKLVYTLVRQFPKFETYGLSDQLRRSSVSIPSNIAEGQARQHQAEFRQFLYVALGSLAEVDTQLILAFELDYISQDQLQNAEQHISEIRRMTQAIIRKLN